jgi:hypothetical protein
MLGGGVLAIIVEGTLAAIWGRRISARAQELSRRTESQVLLIRADVERLSRALAETEILWQPYRRVLRWLRHPVTVALLRSYSRHRATSR